MNPEEQTNLNPTVPMISHTMRLRTLRSLGFTRVSHPSFPAWRVTWSCRFDLNCPWGPTAQGVAFNFGYFGNNCLVMVLADELQL